MKKLVCIEFYMSLKLQRIEAVEKEEVCRTHHTKKLE
jgi:hypothetical protein